MHYPISLYDTLQRSVRPFTPLTDNEVKIYSCGPTVYGIQHLGNMRYVFEVDLLKTVLKHIGWYDVTHVMNITDVGHLTGDNDGDADIGEDRMEKWAKRDNLSVWDVAKKYTDIFLDDIQSIDCNHFDAMPRATAYIVEQIEMVKKLVTQGLTYTIPGDGIYCDTSLIPNYGELLPSAHLQGIKEGARIDAGDKKNPTDFALWKFSPTTCKRAMEWIFSDDQGRTGALITDEIEKTLSDAEQATRWFPGRHIECSAMSYALLGTQIDIHTGGIEHIPIHHTNEIVQSECSYCQRPRVKRRFHLQHLQIDGKKISKSIGNVIYVSEIYQKWFAPEDVRCFFLNAHYRSFQDFTRQNLTASKNMRQNIIKKIALHDLQHIDSHTPWAVYTTLATAIADDLDTVQTLQHLCERVIHDTPAVYDIVLFDQRVLRLWLLEWARKLQQASASIPDDIRVLAEQRLAAKRDKDRSQADQLRRTIEEKGRLLKDTADGYQLEKNI